jgi:hypothetical protein
VQSRTEAKSQTHLSRVGWACHKPTNPRKVSHGLYHTPVHDPTAGRPAVCLQPPGTGGTVPDPDRSAQGARPPLSAGRVARGGGARPVGGVYPDGGLRSTTSLVTMVA